MNTVGQGKNSGCGIGIWDFVAGTAPAKLSLTNSSLQDANDIGLYLEGAGLSVSVSNNVLDLASNTWGIEINNPSGTISSNFVSAPANALVYDPSESGVSITYSGNVLRGTTGCAALDLYRPAQVTGNKIDGCTVGIALEAAPSQLPSKPISLSMPPRACFWHATPLRCPVTPLTMLRLVFMTFPVHYRLRKSRSTMWIR